MHIAGWHIDGFGAFHDYEVADLSPGLTVVFGPNEAGKSTLLWFIRSVLFGFRRADLPQHYPPLAGGRHGGRLRLSTSAGEHLVERYAATRSKPVVRLPDGCTGGEEILRTLLGNADQTLFENVFAFSISELQDFRSLDKQGITERMVAAPLTGGGAPIHKVLEALDERVASLYSGRKTASIPDCLVRLAEGQRALAEARALAADYPALVDAETQAEEQVRRVRRQESDLRAEAARLERLCTAAAAYEDLSRARSELATLPPHSDLETALSRAAALASTAELQRSRLAEAPLAAQRAAEAGRAADRALLELGPDWDEGAVSRLPASLPARDEIRTRGAAADEARTVEIRTRDQLASAQEEVARIADEHERLAAELAGEPPPSAATLDARQDALGRVRAALQERRLLRAQQRPGGAWAPSMLSLAAAAVGAWCMAVGQLAVGLAALVIGLALAALAFAGRHSAEASLTELQRQLDLDLVTLELPSEPSAAQLEDAQARLARAREERRARDELSATLLRTDEHLREATAKAAHQRSLLERVVVDGRTCDAAWQACCLEVGLPEDLTTQGALDFIDCVRIARERLAARDHADRKAADLAAACRQWEDEARAFLAAADTDADADGERLVAATQSVAARLQRRADLEREERRAEERVAAALGRGVAAQGLRAELERGDVSTWRLRLDEIAAELTSLRPELERAVEGRHSAQVARRGLEESADVAALALRQQGLEAELAELMRRWQAATLAAALVRETLEQYTAAHQPAVMAAASRLFAAVTAGRYTQVVRRDGLSGQVEVRTSSGQLRPVDRLSRGTAEQLYLCIRLALAEEFAALGRDLPLLMDEVLVDFDPARASALATALADAAGRHQILLFTCRPETRDLLRDAVPEVRLIELPERPR